jgi:ankyrin repeat protein
VRALLYIRFNILILVSISDDLEKTALHFAAQNGSLDVVKFLAKHGADIDAEGQSLPIFDL